jgi:hypothetical protein
MDAVASIKENTTIITNLLLKVTRHIYADQKTQRPSESANLVHSVQFNVILTGII